MGNMFFLLASIVRCFLYVMEWLLFFRAVFSWFPIGVGGFLSNFIFGMTEPLIGFVRGLITKVRVLREFPIDLSFVFSYLLIWFLLAIL